MREVAILILMALSTMGMAQSFAPFSVSIEPMVNDDVPGVHSFARGQATDGKWLIVGGRTDGLHRRQPWAAFLAEDNNTVATVIDPLTMEVWTRSLQELATPIFEQLQSTNLNFVQVDNKLVITGGYGYSATAGDHLTYPNITFVDVNEMVAAIVDNQPITPFVTQLDDTTMAITGGHMGYLDGIYYLVGGQEFNGRYNPMGPNHGPGFYQKYSAQVRKFELDFSGMVPVVNHLTPMTDTVVLPRRDYNMAPQVFENGDVGFTVFSGVFRKPDDTPFFDIVNIRENNYEVVPNFTQLLSHYHSARFPMFDSVNNTMHTIFFGGMAQYYYDETGALINDEEVPFAKTISRVTRLSNGEYEEVKLNIEMPSFLGAGAEFIPAGNYYTDEILHYHALPENNKTLIGYIYGGIHSTAENIFFINDGLESTASNTIFKVYIDNTITDVKELKSNGVFDLIILPNPTSSGQVYVQFRTVGNQNIAIDLIDMNGQKIRSLFDYPLDFGEYRQTFDLDNLASGQYLMRISDGSYSQFKTLILH